MREKIEMLVNKRENQKIANLFYGQKVNKTVKIWKIHNLTIMLFKMQKKKKICLPFFQVRKYKAHADGNKINMVSFLR